MQPRCEKCKHWDDSVPPYLDGGKCWRIESGLGIGVAAYVYGIIDDDDHDNDPQLRTDKSFGCILYEAKA